MGLVWLDGSQWIYNVDYSLRCEHGPDESYVFFFMGRALRSGEADSADEKLVTRVLKSSIEIGSRLIGCAILLKAKRPKLLPEPFSFFPTAKEGSRGIVCQ